jgi:preprotein translocase subunit SecG
VIYLLYTLHIIICLFLILVVLLQQGKGADLSVFGGGSTMTAFGARSATTLLHRLTVGAFVGFVLTTVLIAYLQGGSSGSSVMGRSSRPAPPAPASAPATTPAPAEGAGAPATAPATPADAPPPAPATPPAEGQAPPPSSN